MTNNSANELCEAILLFYDAPIWRKDVEQVRWKELTGYDEASTRTLCEYVRSVNDSVIVSADRNSPEQ